jgi:hypothetical protein
MKLNLEVLTETSFELQLSGLKLTQEYELGYGVKILRYEETKWKGERELHYTGH